MTRETAFAKMTLLLNSAIKAGLFNEVKAVIDFNQALETLRPPECVPLRDTLERLTNKVDKHEKIN